MTLTLANGRLDHTETMTQELSGIADDMTSLLPLFRDGGSISGLILPTEHAARFKAMAIDAKAMLDQQLGRANDYSMNLLHAVNSGAGGYFGGPSYASVEEAAQIVRAGIGAISRSAAKPVSVGITRPAYVDPVRTAQLRALISDKWDFSRLVELCRELNVAAANQCHMSTGFLLRSIMNHVAPIFGFESFARVASEYPFAKSVKAGMQRLQGQGRDGADFHLHQPIRTQESLPTATQVAFSQELDVLLSEVIRVARASGE
ncbi:hypothetical protein Hden_0659 [Hyphomicrobium denitrificans ATCC 51888]|uniref:Uncharacterized protein n=1 Tax=Hyphomicrobium denitrificans (strain ATCC 51888 / DSM 1869 / NCIMB 11706 / TK 0415) TaxID=582899 RepID=D8JSZ5_HYPDA|nr:hypothetical protein [Hyphomicrobium denitrificans]ADJ22480.1 hypothetical protein Hden_0659 [Hyphomicrobium denitrificans ATCC 51888]